MSSALTPCNARVLQVLRASDATYDQYGQAQEVVAFTLVKCRLTLRNKVTVGEDGDAIKLDGTLWFPPNIELLAGDIIVIDTAGEPKYKVITVSESRNVLGVAQGRIYGIVRQRDLNG